MMMNGDAASNMDATSSGMMDATMAMNQDARPRMDAEITDTPSRPDTGVVRDVGFVRDVGVIRDSGPIQDSGPSVDAGPVACTIDSQCAPSGWCRELQGGGRACTPFRNEGQSCGGFVAGPWLYERCLTTLTCMGRHPLLADAPGICVMAATARELEAMPQTYNRHVVGVNSAYAVIGVPGCTRIGCPNTDMCCNTCNATEFLSDSQNAMSGIPIVDSTGNAYTCDGHYCTDAANNRVSYRDQCDLPPGRYRFIGTFTAGPPAQFQTTHPPGMYP